MREKRKHVYWTHQIPKEFIESAKRGEIGWVFMLGRSGPVWVYRPDPADAKNEIEIDLDLVK